MKPWPSSRTVKNTGWCIMSIISRGRSAACATAARIAAPAWKRRRAARRTSKPPRASWSPTNRTNASRTTPVSAPARSERSALRMAPCNSTWSLCFGCGLCVSACPQGALHMQLRERPPYLPKSARELTNRMMVEVVTGMVTRGLKKPDSRHA